MRSLLRLGYKRHCSFHLGCALLFSLTFCLGSLALEESQMQYYEQACELNRKVDHPAPVRLLEDCSPKLAAGLGPERPSSELCR